MKYIVFANRVKIDRLINRGVEAFLKDSRPYEVMTIDCEKEFILALAGVEQYGSFCFISEKKYDKLK
jgi:hypothetical protein